MRSDRRDRTSHSIINMAKRRSVGRRFLSCVLVLGMILSLAVCKTSVAAQSAEYSAEYTALIAAVKDCFKSGREIDTTEFRLAYNLAEELFSNASIAVKEEADDYDHVYLAAFGELEDLIEKAYDVVEAVDNIPDNITESTYGSFINQIEEADKRVDSYYAYYDDLRKSDDGKTTKMISYCVVGGKRDYLVNDPSYIPTREYGSNIEYIYKIDSNNSSKKVLDKLAEKKKIYNILKAYSDVRSQVGTDEDIKTTGITDEKQKYLEEFYNKYVANSGDALISYLSNYNGNEIKALITKYIHIKTFRAALATFTTSKPETEAEIRNAIQTYTLYKNLTDDEKAMITDDDRKLLDNYCLNSTGVKNINDYIAAIVWPTDDKTYSEFKTAYEKAMVAYEALIGQYGSTSGVDNLVTDKELLLGDMTIVKNMIESIKDMCNKVKNDPVSACGYFLIGMTKIYNDYNGMSLANRSRIYNWASFYNIYTDTKSAYNLRARVDKLKIAVTEEDEAEVASIRKAFTELNDNAKTYFGTTYENEIAVLEYTIYTLKTNNASYVIDLINKIGPVTRNSGSKIIAAEQAYARLSDTAKSLVTNYPTLVEARKAYDAVLTDIGAATVTNIKGKYVFTGSAIKPKPNVVVDGVTLIKDEDYTVTYSSNKNVGTATVKIKAIDGSGYKGTFKKTFKIIKDSLSTCGVIGLAKKYKYTGKAIKPSFKVKVNGHILKKSRDYTLKYYNNKKKGTAKVKITGKGNYKGSRTVKFKIVKK